MLIAALVGFLIGACFLGFMAGMAYKEESKTVSVVPEQPKVVYKIFGMEIIKLCPEHIHLLPKKKLAVIDHKKCYFCPKK